MNESIRPITERLYLQKDEEEEIYVDSMLHQHHIDGIRFLFKHFKRRKPGVIINNPLGYGNSLQVALFLGAIHHMLDKPILIVRKQSKESNWPDHFQKLTRDNVVVAAPNPFVKKLIFINTMENIELFCRRHWSIMVVDDDDFFKKKTLPTMFKADYKICITPVDMKENLETFSVIYKWLYPIEKFNIEDFKIKPGRLKQVVSQSIKLEAFLQDIVYRTNLLTPFENPYEETAAQPHQTSKKNKDATGTKIKRSKRSIDDLNLPNNQENEPSVSSVRVPKINDKYLNKDSNGFNVGNVSNYVEGEAMDSDEKQSDIDIESFIRNKEPIKYDAFKDYIQEFDNISNNSQEKMEFIDDESDSNFGCINHNLDTDMNIADNPGNYCLDSDTNSESSIQKNNSFVNEHTKSQDSNDSDYDLETQKILTNENIGSESENDYELRYETEKQTLEITLEREEIGAASQKQEANEVDDIKSETNSGCDNKHNDNIDVTVGKRKLGEFFSVNELEFSKDNKSNSETEKGSQINDTSKTNDIDAKVTEHMENVLKKFKGTVLDSLF